MGKLFIICLVIGILLVTLISAYLFLPAQTSSLFSSFSSVLGFSDKIITYQPQGTWRVLKATGNEANFTIIFSNAKDKKTDICMVLKSRVNPASVNLNPLYIYSQSGSYILDDKSKPIQLKYETSKCLVNGTLKDGYHISLTEAQAVNINNYIKIGNQTIILGYIPIKTAYHLNSTGGFIEDITDLVKYKDLNFSLIPLGDIVQVIFTQNLTNKNDISTYAKTNDTCTADLSISTPAQENLAVIGGIKNYSKYFTLLPNMVGESDTFNLKVNNCNTLFDWILDPECAGTIKDCRYSTQSTCEANSCYWDGFGTCQPVIGPPDAYCNDFPDETTCGQNSMCYQSSDPSPPLSSCFSCIWQGYFCAGDIGTECTLPQPIYYNYTLLNATNNNVTCFGNGTARLCHITEKEKEILVEQPFDVSFGYLGLIHDFANYTLYTQSFGTSGYTTNGRIGGGALFNGGTINNDIRTNDTNNPDLSLNSSTLGYSFFIWTLTNTTQSGNGVNRGIAGKGGGGNYEWKLVGNLYTNGIANYYFNTYTLSGGGGSSIASNNIDYSNKWIFVGFTIDKVTKKANLYINGVLNGSVTYTGSAGNGNASITIGDFWSGTIWNGTLDGAILLNRTLSATEVANLYNSNMNKYYYIGSIGFNNLSIGENNTAINVTLQNATALNGTKITGQWNNGLELEFNMTTLKISQSGIPQPTNGANFTVRLYSTSPDNRFYSPILFGDNITIAQIYKGDPTPATSFQDPTLTNNTQVNDTSFVTNVTINQGRTLQNVTYMFNNNYYTILDNRTGLFVDFDDNSGGSYIRDASPYSNNLTVVSTGANTSGVYGQGLIYTAASKNRQYTADSPILNTSGAFSVAFWVNLTSANPNNGIATKGNLGSNQGAWNIHLYPASNITFTLNGNTTEGAGTITGSNLTLNTWHFVVANWNGTTPQLWVDNIKVREGSYSTPLTTNTNNLYIGCYYSDGTPSYCFTGVLDNFMYMNRSLSVGEINQLYMSGLTKLNNENWTLYTNQSGLTNGTYTYQAIGGNTQGTSLTEKRTIRIGTLADTTYPQFYGYDDNNNLSHSPTADTFQVNVNSTNGTVILHINNQDVIASLISDNLYSAIANFTENKTYTYNWTAYGSGSSNLLNTSEIRNYTLLPPLLVLNLVSPVDYYNSTTTSNTFVYNFTNETATNCSLYINEELNLTNSTPIINTNSQFIQTFANGNYNWSIGCYDNINNQLIISDMRNINVSISADTIPPYFTYLANVSIYTNESVGIDFNATDETAFDSFKINWTNTFSINQTGYLQNTSGLSAGMYYINVSINDTSNNINSSIIWVNVTISCTQNLTNTTWSDWSNQSCVSTQRNQSRTRTQYDSNACGYTNLTIYDSQLVGPTYQNTSFGSWSNLGCINNDMNQSRNATQYDIYSCASNTTVYQYQLLTANLTNTTWSAWSNVSCVSIQLNQSRTRTEYDSNAVGCFSNLTITGSQLLDPIYQNTSWGSWANTGICNINDTQNQVSNLTQYDLDKCASNSTVYQYQGINCNYCSYNVVNSSWSNWVNVSCVSSQMNQSSFKTEYDSNYSTCYAVTLNVTDLWNSGNNNTYWQYQFNGTCGDITTPTWVNCRNFTTYANNSFSQSITATDDSGIDTYWLNDTTNFWVNLTTGLIKNNTQLSDILLYNLNISVNDTYDNINSCIFWINVTETSLGTCNNTYSTLKAQASNKRPYGRLCYWTDFR